MIRIPLIATKTPFHFTSMRVNFYHKLFQRPPAIAAYTKSNTASKVAKGSFMALQRRCARP
jgi:hypothetical protein